MTEAEWLTEDDLEYLLDFFEDKASSRKLRLFAVACVRSILHQLPDQNCRRSVEVAEEYADSRTTLEELRKLHAAFDIEMNNAWRDASRVELDGIVYFAMRQDALAFAVPAVAQAITKEVFDEVCARDTIDAIASVLTYSAIPPDEWTSADDDAAMRTMESERPKQLHLFRDVFCNPLRPVSLKRTWLTWNDRTVVKLAQFVYEDRAFDKMGLLADALEDAGCTDADILTHCRGAGPHVRGCWVVDLLLGKT